MASRPFLTCRRSRLESMGHAASSMLQQSCGPAYLLLAGPVIELAERVEGH